MKSNSRIRRLIARNPRQLLAVLAAISALLVPAAVAWACLPQPVVRTDKLSYNPGEQMTVSGSFFRPNEPITITTDPPGSSASGVPVTPAGTFRTQLDAPDQPGSYTLVAQGSSTPAARTAFVVNTPPRTVPAPPPKQCSDGQDNEGDGRTDYPRDPGCSSPTDDNESNPAPANPCTITGTGGNDVIRGTSGPDVICAGAGNDVVYGRGGNDIIRGGEGNDVLRGGGGGDRLIGGPGRDVLYGGEGTDALDTEDGRGGNDIARGGDGSDSCRTDRSDVRSSC